MEIWLDEVMSEVQRGLSNYNGSCQSITNYQYSLVNMLLLSNPWVDILAGTTPCVLRSPYVTTSITYGPPHGGSEEPGNEAKSVACWDIDILFSSLHMAS